MRPLIVLFLFFISTATFSQSKFTIEGTLHAESNKVVTLGDVLLYQKDQIAAFTSVDNGRFTFEPQVSEVLFESYLCRL